MLLEFNKIMGRKHCLLSKILHSEDFASRRKCTAKSLYREYYDREDFDGEDSPAKTCPRIHCKRRLRISMATSGKRGVHKMQFFSLRLKTIK